MNFDLDGKQLWTDCSDSDGWISKEVEEVKNFHEDWSIDFEQALEFARNFYEIEFENQSQLRWRFID